MVNARTAAAEPAEGGDGATRFRLVAADLDGTLLRSDGAIADQTARAVRLAAERGVVVCLATSRRLIGAEPVAEALHLTGPLILYDGAQVCAYPGGEALASWHVAADVAERAAAAMLECGLRPIAQHVDVRGEVLVAWPARSETGAEDEYVARFADQIVEAPADLRALAGAGPLRLLAFGDYDRLRFAARSIAHLPCGRQLLREGNYGTAELTVFDPQASKGNALRWLAARLDIPMARTFAIGDGVNDVSLLSAAGFSVAMGNAGPEAKEVADVITRTNDEDGVAAALERYVLDGAGCGERASCARAARAESEGETQTR